MARIPIFIGNPGFLLEFIPTKIGAGMTDQEVICGTKYCQKSFTKIIHIISETCHWDIFSFLQFIPSSMTDRTKP